MGHTCVVLHCAPMAATVALFIPWGICDARRMQQATQAKPSRFKTRAYALFIWAFLCLWLAGMTSGLMAGACRNDRFEGAKKLRFCNISLTAAAVLKFSALERAKGSIIHLEKGIALSQLGKTADAAEAFAQALRDAKARPGPWERNLHQRMLQNEDRNARALWVSVVAATQ